MLDVLKHPRGGHLAYAITCSLGSHTLRPHWEGNPNYNVASILQAGQTARTQLREPTPTASEAQFDSQPNLKVVNISCQPERMLFTVKQFAVHGRPAGEDRVHQPRRDRSQPGDRQARRAGRSRHGRQRDGQGPAKRQLRFRPRLEAAT